MPSLECFSWETLKVQCITLITDLLIEQQPPASLHRLTAWELTVWVPERAGITAIGLRGKSGYRQLGHNTLRLQVEAVSFSFILPGCYGDDGADLCVAPHWDVMCCVGDTYWYAGVPHNQGQVGLISSPKDAFKLHPAHAIEVGIPSRKSSKIYCSRNGKKKSVSVPCIWDTYLTVMILNFCLYSSLRSKTQNPDYPI